MPALKTKKKTKKQYDIKQVIEGNIILLLVVAGLFFVYHHYTTKEVVPTIISAPSYIKVETMLSEQMLIPKQTALYGIAESAKRIILKSEIDGRVAKIIAVSGTYLQKDAPILQLNLNTKKALHAKAEAVVKRTRIKYENALLYRKSKSIIASSEAEYDEAKADLVKAEIDLESSIIKAPFDGVVENIFVREGDIIKAYNHDLVDYLNDDSLIIKSFLSEEKVGELRPEMLVHIKFADDIKKTGFIRHISNAADIKNRSFVVEVEMLNLDGLIRDGMNAELLIETDKISVSVIPTAILVLNDEGVIGVKLVNEKQEVEFAPVNIIDEKNDQLYITGLDANAEIIIAGQGFARVGNRVETVRRQREL
jgi:multidrug efflux system membrane fusion protein